MKLHYAKLPPVLLAVLLQFAPLLKMLQSSPALANSPLAIVLKWATAAAAMWGGVHAVSGASTNILITSTNASFGTNGAFYKYTITTSDHKDGTGHIFTASNRPNNLTLTIIEGSGGALANVTGTPTNFGIWLVGLTAGYTNGGNVIYAVPTNMLLTLYGMPIITNQPVNVTNFTGANASFSVVAGALPPPTYRWRLGASTLPNETNATLNLTNLNGGQAGNYTVVLSNFVGSVTSQVAILSVASGPSFSSVQKTNNQIALRFTQNPGATYQVQFSPKIPTNSWQTLTNLPPQPQATNITVTDSITNNPARFYQLRLTIP